MMLLPFTQFAEFTCCYCCCHCCCSCSCTRCSSCCYCCRRASCGISLSCRVQSARNWWREKLKNPKKKTFEKLFDKTCSNNCYCCCCSGSNRLLRRLQQHSKLQTLHFVFDRNSQPLFISFLALSDSACCYCCCRGVARVALAPCCVFY